MAAKSIIFSFLVLLNFISRIQFCHSQFSFPQNIQTFYPLWPDPIAPTPNSPPNESISPTPVPTRPPQLPPPVPQPLPLPPSSPVPALPPVQQPSKTSTKKAVATAVVATAASALVISGVVFFLLQRRTRHMRDKKMKPNPFAASPMPREQFKRFNENLKAIIVDEDGLDVIYWRKLQGKDSGKDFNKREEFSTKRDEEKVRENKVSGRGSRREKSGTPVQEVPLLKGKSSTSHDPIWAEKEEDKYQTVNQAQPSVGIVFKSTASEVSSAIPKAPSPPPQPPNSTTTSAIPKAPSPPPPPPPRPPNSGGSVSSSSKPPPPPPPKGVPSKSHQGQPSSSGKDVTSSDNGQVPLKPLHWDKVNPNVDHSMVWHKIDGGSFR